VLVVSLVEEHVFAVARALCCILLENAVFADTVLQAQLERAARREELESALTAPPVQSWQSAAVSHLAPELAPNLVAALSHLQRDDFPAQQSVRALLAFILAIKPLNSGHTEAWQAASIEAPNSR